MENQSRELHAPVGGQNHKLLRQHPSGLNAVLIVMRTVPWHRALLANLIRHDDITTLVGGYLDGWVCSDKNNRTKRSD